MWEFFLKQTTVSSQVVAQPSLTALSLSTLLFPTVFFQTVFFTVENNQQAFDDYDQRDFILKLSGTNNLPEITEFA